MTRNELRAKADGFRQAASFAKTLADRNVLLRKAGNYYEDAGFPRLAASCRKVIGE